MHDIDSGFLQLCLLSCALFVYLWRGSKGNVNTRHFKFSKKINDPDEILKELDSLPPQARQAVEKQLKRYTSLAESKSVNRANDVQNVSPIAIFPNIGVKTRSVSVRTSNPALCLGVGLICLIGGSGFNNKKIKVVMV